MLSFLLVAASMLIGRHLLAAWLSGWLDFRIAFPPEQDEILSTYSFVTARFRYTQPKSFSVRMGRRGLHLAPLLPFRPLFWSGYAFVRWEELTNAGPISPWKSVGEVVWNRFGSRIDDLSFPLADMASIAVRDQIQDHARNRWPAAGHEEPHHPTGRAVSDQRKGGHEDGTRPS